MRRMRSECESGLATLSKWLVGFRPRNSCRGFRVHSAYLGVRRWHRHVPWRQLRVIQLFMRQLASSCRPTFAYLTSYFDDDTFIRFQVYGSIYFSWPAIQAAG